MSAVVLRGIDVSVTHRWGRGNVKEETSSGFQSLRIA